MKVEHEEQIKKEIINGLTPLQKKFVESGVRPLGFCGRGIGKTYAMAARLAIACINDPFCVHLWLTERPKHCQDFFAGFLGDRRIPFTRRNDTIKLDWETGIATVQFSSGERKNLAGMRYKSVHCDPENSWACSAERFIHIPEADGMLSLGDALWQP